MTPFWGVSYEEGRNGGLSQRNTKFINLKQTAVSAFLPMNQNNMSSRSRFSGRGIFSSHQELIKKDVYKD